MSENKSDIPEITSRAEARYITKRKIKAMLNSICFYVCRIFPIKNNLISVCTFEGKGGFGCNPKYLVQELHRRNPDYEFVWFVNDLSKEFPDYIRKVPNTTWSRAYWLGRSKLWIDNYRKPYGTVKRKGQYYLNANHFTLGIKCTGLLRGKGFSRMAYLVNKNDSDMTDGLLIDSGWCEECFEKAMVYSGPMLKTGSPRCDILYGDRTQQKAAFRKKHGLPLEAKVLLYAPTFREGAKEGKRSVYAEKMSIDLKRLIHNLEAGFGGEWYICYRVHPQLAEAFGEYTDSSLGARFINETAGDDLYELMAGMDAYVTDYSSAVFEAGYAGIPAFIYADDIAEYKENRGNLYWNLAEADRHRITNNKDTHPDMELILPFTVATDNEELENDILSFDMDDYTEKLADFHEKIDLIFDGKATERVADYIIEKEWIRLREIRI